MNNVTKWIKKVGIVMVATVLSFEGLSFLATKQELFLVNETPSAYNDPILKVDDRDIAFGRTEREPWGAWHVPDASFRHSKSCFDVTMTFNEVGARDDSFKNLPANSLFLLGDSFAEGFGVEKENTSEYLIETGLGLSVLNFGASGNFGPLQQLLIYDNFRHITHQGLIVFVLPSNDFTDNDVEFWRRKNQTRYRPYFNPTGDPLTPYYFPTAVPRDNFLSTSHGGLKQLIKDYFWSSNALRTALYIIRGDTANSTELSEDSADLNMPSYFYDASDKQQSHLVLAHEAILESAHNRNVLFVLIPGQGDITRWQSESHRASYKQNYWYQSFLGFQNRSEQRVEVLDLFDYLPPKTNELFFECDGHWSPSGNAWAAEVIMKHIRKTKLFSDIN